MYFFSVIPIQNEHIKTSLKKLRWYKLTVKNILFNKIYKSFYVLADYMLPEVVQIADGRYRQIQPNLCAYIDGNKSAPVYL